MDLNKDASKEAPKAERESQKNAINKNEHGAVPIDPPPSYNEAMQIHPYQDLSNSAQQQQPTAPSLANINEISHPYNNVPPGNLSQTGVPYDSRFQHWDRNATRIVIINRLQMNDRFQSAKSRMEEELLWHIILNDLTIHGYHSTIYDLIQYWGYLYQVYLNMLDSVVSGFHHTDWEFFPFMHQTLGGNDGAKVLDTIPDSTMSPGPTVLPVSTVFPDTAIIPATTTESIQSHRMVENLGTPSTLPNSNAPNVSTTDELTSVNMLNPPASASASVAQLSLDDRTPLLMQNGNQPVLQTEILSKSSNLVTESSSDPLPSSATTLLPASATLPSTSVVPAVMTIPEPPSNLTDDLEMLSTLPQTDAAIVAPSIAPSSGDIMSSTAPLLNSQASVPMANVSSAVEQAPLLLQATDQGTNLASSDVWVKSNAFLGEPSAATESIVKPAFQMTSTDEAFAGAGECMSNSGPLENLMKCIPPVELSANPDVGLTAITTQPDGSSLAKIFDDSSVITTQPTAIPTFGDNGTTESGDCCGGDGDGDCCGCDGDDGCCGGGGHDDCCDTCCGDDFCCGDCYCEGGDCDVGDC